MAVLEAETAKVERRTPDFHEAYMRARTLERSLRQLGMAPAADTLHDLVEAAYELQNKLDATRYLVSEREIEDLRTR